MFVQRRKTIIFVLIGILIIAGAGCSQQETSKEIQECTLDIHIEPEGAGTVEKSPDKTSYKQKEVIQLTAQAKPGWEFDHWEGGLTGSQTPVDIVIESDTDIIAVFQETDAPVISIPRDSYTVKCGEILTFQVTAEVPDKPDAVITLGASGDLVQYFDSENGQFSWTPTEADIGDYSITFTAENNGKTASREVSVTVVSNPAPVLEPVGDKELVETETLGFTVTAIDPDGEELNYNASGDLAQYFDLDTQTFNWTTDYGDAGLYSLTIGVSDGKSEVSEEITVSVGIKFDDALLEEAIINHSQASITGDIILPAEVQNITTLDHSNIYSSDPGIESLTGIEYLTSLIDLNLTRNKVTDISPLAGINSIQNLTLFDNPLNSIDSLSSLKNLVQLDLGKALNSNSISDLGPLNGLSNLRKLDLSYNFNTIDYSTLSNSSIEELKLFNSGVEDDDLAYIGDLTNLVVLDLAYGNITNLGELATLTNLRTLKLSSLAITSIEPVSQMEYLTTLEIKSSPGISDYTPCADLNNLNSLSLLYNEITDIGFLSSSGLSSLSYLNMRNNSISDIAPLLDLKETAEDLRIIYISDNALDLSDQATIDIIDQLEAAGITVYY